MSIKKQSKYRWILANARSTLPQVQIPPFADICSGLSLSFPDWKRTRGAVMGSIGGARPKGSNMGEYRFLFVFQSWLALITLLPITPQ